MNQLNRFLKQLDKIDDQQNTSRSSFSSRKFPRKQYMKASRRIMISLVCVIVLAGSVVVYGGVRLHQRSSTSTVRRYSTVHRSLKNRDNTPTDQLIKPKTGGSAKKSASPSRGRAILKRWVADSHYSPGKSDYVLRAYKSADPYWKGQINRQLIYIHNNYDRAAARQQIYEILSQAKIL